WVKVSEVLQSNVWLTTRGSASSSWIESSPTAYSSRGLKSWSTSRNDTFWLHDSRPRESDELAEAVIVPWSRYNAPGSSSFRSSRRVLNFALPLHVALLYHLALPPGAAKSVIGERLIERSGSVMSTRSSVRN